MDDIQNIGLGSAPNDGQGDNLRTGGQKINENFKLLKDLAFRQIITFGQESDDNITAHVALFNNRTPVEVKFPARTILSFWNPTPVGIRNFRYILTGDFPPGVYGQGELQIPSLGRLLLLSVRGGSAEDAENDPTTQFIDFPNLTTQNVSEWLNEQSPAILIQSQSEGLRIFRGQENGVPVSYLFTANGGSYGLLSDQSDIEDFEPLEVSPDATNVDTQLNANSLNAIANSAVSQEFERTNHLGLSLNQSITSQFDVNFINYRFIHKVDPNTIDITGRLDAPNDFNCYGVVESGSINFLVESGLVLFAPNGATVNAGEYFHFVKIDDGKTFVLIRYNYGSGSGSINNITEIPNRSYNDLQNLPNLQALAFLNSVGTNEITNNSVTNAKLANMNEGTIKGRLIANGVPQDLNASEVRSILGVKVSVTQPPQLVNGVVQVNLSNPQGIFSESTVTTTEQFEVIAGAVTGGIHVFRVNLPTDPDASITGATRYVNSEFIADVDLLLVFERFNFGTRYYFLEI